MRKPVPTDYNEDPARFRTARGVLRAHAREKDVHGRVARQLLADRSTVRDCLIGKGVERAAASLAAHEVTVPLTVTKRGELAFGRTAA